MDLAVYRDTKAMGNGGSPVKYFSDKGLIDAGYTYEYISPANRNSNLATVKDGVLAMDGPSYKALIIDNEDAMTLAVACSVTLRYLHFRSPIWVLQYTEYALLWITFLGAAWLLKKDGHIRIDSALTRLPPDLRRKVETLNDMIGLAVALVVFIFGALHTQDLCQRGVLEVKGTNVPKYLIFWIIPLGGLALAVQFARRIAARPRRNASSDPSGT